MHFVTTKEKILKAVLIAERLVGKKESLPVLSCIVLSVSKELSVRATNLEAGVEVRVGGEVIEPGIVAVPASILSQTLRVVSGDKITLRSENNNLHIESRGSKTLIKAISHEEFPSLASKEGGADVRISRESLLTALQSVSYAASSSMIRPELGSVYLSIKEESLTAVATDSFRLAEKSITGSVQGSPKDVLIPLKHVQELLHTLERLTDEHVTISIEDSQVILSGDNVQFVSRIIDGTFPNYKEIMPKTFSTEVTLLKGDFVETLRKARVFSGADQHVGFHAYPKKKVFDITAQSAAVGEMSDSLEAALTGEDIDANFHIGYVADCIQSLSTDSIVLGFSGAGKPLVIRGVSEGSFTYLVMPLNR